MKLKIYSSIGHKKVKQTGSHWSKEMKINIAHDVLSSICYIVNVKNIPIKIIVSQFEVMDYLLTVTDRI